jgi:hypothetical protein
MPPGITPQRTIMFIVVAFICLILLFSAIEWPIKLIH